MAARSRTGELAVQCVEDSKRWFPETANSVAFGVLAMAGEVGELANLVKKVERGSLSMKDSKTKYAIQMELTDVFIYLLQLSALLDVDLEKSYEIKRAENNRRFTEERRVREEKRIFDANHYGAKNA